jgi:7-carboxy-7-deazaguanine synthase
MLKVTEIFHSIQGESTHAGRPCVFVRLAGCDLRCTWCDTPGSLTTTGSTPMSVEGILAEVDAFGCGLVEVTGGEPLLQHETPALLTALCDRGFEVLLETGGHRDVSAVDPRVARIVDIKCPGSGEVDANRWENLALLRPRDEVKFVVADAADFGWARDVTRRHGLEARTTVLFSPVHGRLSPGELGRWLVESGLRARMQLQLHKYLEMR